MNNLNTCTTMFRRANILLVTTVILFSAYGYAQNCTKLHEISDICGNFCGPTCVNPLPLPIFCPYILCRWNDGDDCRCENGYVRDINSTECVILDDCQINYS